MNFRVFLLTLALAGLVSAQDAPVSDATGAYRTGGGVTAPIPIKRPDPHYSEKARKAKLQGSVILEIVVGTNGKCEEPKVIRPLGLGLDEEAIKAVKKWKFTPGMKREADGSQKPVRVRARVEVNFRLL